MILVVSSRSVSRRVSAAHRLALPIVLALAILLAPLAATAGLLVTVGEVTSTSAIVWARGDAAGEATVEAKAGDRAAVTVKLRFAPERDFTGRGVLANLAPATRYTYRIVAGGETVSGEFVTAPSAADPRAVKFLWSGDLGGGGFCRRIDGGYPIFVPMAKAKPDFFLFVGDTIYADVPCDKPGTVPGAAFAATTLPEFHAKHRYNREDDGVQRFFRATSVYAIWDDHEVRNDFSGPTEPLMPVGRQAFLDYWPIAPPPDDPTRLYRRVRWGQLAEIFVLDARQYRSPNTARDGPDKTMLGAEQRRWIIDAVATSSAVWKIVVSSIPLSVPVGRPERHDSWSNASVFGLPEPNGTGFAVERDAILKAFRDRGVRNLIFLAADVHLAEVIRHEPVSGFAFHELIAGPLSATFGRPRPLDQGLNPVSIFARGGLNNFGEVIVDRSGLSLRLIGEDGTVLFTHAIRPE